MTFIDYLNVGGQFTFPVNLLTKNLKYISGSSAKRNKGLPKSSRPMYNSNRIISKAKSGKKLDKNYLDYKNSFNFMGFDPIVATPSSQSNKISSNKSLKKLDDLYTDKIWNILSLQTSENPETTEYDLLHDFSSFSDIADQMHTLYLALQGYTTSTVSTPILYTSYDSKKYEGNPGYSGFRTAYANVAKSNPLASKYQPLLTNIANSESSFRTAAKNENYPAYGLFLFVEKEDGTKNISNYAKKYAKDPDKFTIEEFLNNPEMLINAAIDLAENFRKLFTLEDLKKAKEKGFTMNALIAGSWLGGVDGVRLVLNGTGNPSDRKWSKDGKGTDVLTVMKQNNTY